jgi:aspartyl-tRNA(Asn)/glutamyl-tRNA(Gln) amidotransferase subunit A
LAARRRIAAEFADVFARGIDLLFTPTTPTTAFKAGEKINNPVSMYQSDAFVCPANLAQVPAVSLPIGKANGLPVGGQLIGPKFAEAMMLGAASLLEKQVDAKREF